MWHKLSPLYIPDIVGHDNDDKEEEFCSYLMRRISFNFLPHIYKYPSIFSL